MAGFFRKVAGAFVELDESSGDKGAGARRPGDANLDEITRGASELLAQLETVQSTESGGAAPNAALAAGDPARAGAGAAGAMAADSPADSVMTLTAEEVFVRSGQGDGPQSAPRVLKIIAGLAMFPPEQQIVMVRAMDQADDTWSEDQVLDDARQRQSALRSHLQAVETERGARIQDLDGRIESTQTQGRQLIEEIDRQVAELTGQREAAIADNTSAVNRLEQQKKEVEDQAEKARRGITHVINALSGLMGFFGGGKGASTAAGERKSQTKSQSKSQSKS